MIRFKTRFRRRKIIWRRKKGRSDGRSDREEKDNMEKKDKILYRRRIMIRITII